MSAVKGLNYQQAELRFGCLVVVTLDIVVVYLCHHSSLSHKMYCMNYVFIKYTADTAFAVHCVQAPRTSMFFRLKL